MVKIRIGVSIEETNSVRVRATVEIAHKQRYNVGIAVLSVPTHYS